VIKRIVTEEMLDWIEHDAIDFEVVASPSISMTRASDSQSKQQQSEPDSYAMVISSDVARGRIEGSATSTAVGPRGHVVEQGTHPPAEIAVTAERVQREVASARAAMEAAIAEKKATAAAKHEADAELVSLREDNAELATQTAAAEAKAAMVRVEAEEAKKQAALERKRLEEAMVEADRVAKAQRLDLERREGELKAALAEAVQAKEEANRKLDALEGAAGASNDSEQRADKTSRTCVLQ
jgi:hypothetical protein